MGRVKLKIKRLESSTSRLTTYSKRKNGLIKKANELSVLCDIDIALLMFSPSGRPVLWKGKNSGIEGIIERYAELTPQERAKRKLESFDALKRSYSKSDHTVNLQDFFGTRYQTTGDLMAQANLMHTNLSEIQKRLSDWNNPDKIDSLEILEQMEDYVRELLEKIRRRKENTGNQQFWEVGCTNQIPNGTHLPFSLGADQQVCHFPSVQNDDSQHAISPKESNFLLHREAEFSAGYSVGNCAGFFGTVEKVEISSRGQECGIMSELLRTESLRNELIGLKTETLRYGFSKAESLKNQLMKTDYSRIESISTEFLAHELVKTESLMNELIKAESMRNELMKSESLRNEFIKTESLRNEIMKTESLRNELMEAESFKLQLYEGYSHPNKQHSSTLPDKNLQQAQHINLQLSIDDYCAEGNFETPESGYGCKQHNLASSSGNSAVATFDEYLYTQQHFLPEGLVAEEPGPLLVNPTNQLRLTK